MIYPDEKDAFRPIARTSVRLERMAEGVRDVNKLMVIAHDIPLLEARWLLFIATFGMH